MRPTRLLVVTLALGLLAIACGSPEIVPERYRPTDAWDAYRHGLELAGLIETALGRDWIRSAEVAVSAPVRVELPYEEQGAFDPGLARAAGFGFAALRGQRVRVQLQLEGEPSPGRLFLDLFRVVEGEEPVLVASAPEGERRLAFEPRRDGEYVLRVQPELLRGGAFRLRMSVEASLEFPVAGRDMSAAWSGFGAPRDGGSRSHHGVDIFARRGTPVLAATRAFVRRVEERGRGGKVIWLRDPERDLHLYYAHLDAQEIEEGVWVEPGQVIGRVGNTGNARTTPPHLHFGIYVRGEGPVDPDPFLRPPGGRLAPLTADPHLVGAWGVIRASAPLRRGTNRGERVLIELDPGARLRVWAATGDHYRVALADGTAGFVSESLVGVFPPDPD